MSYNSGVIGLVVSNRPRATRSADLKLLARLLPELYSTQSYYHYLLIFFFSFAFRFQVFYTISQPTPEWDGYEGRVSMEMLLEILPPPPSAGHERELLIAVCGPDAFTQHMVR